MATDSITAALRLAQCCRNAVRRSFGSLGARGPHPTPHLALPCPATHHKLCLLSGCWPITDRWQSVQPHCCQHQPGEGPDCGAMQQIHVVYHVCVWSEVPPPPTNLRGGVGHRSGFLFVRPREPVQTSARSSKNADSVAVAGKVPDQIDQAKTGRDGADRGCAQGYRHSAIPDGQCQREEGRQ